MRAVRQRRSAWVDCWRDPAAASVSPLNLVFELSGGDFGRGLYRGDHSPVGYGPAGINAAAMWRIKVASGQAAAKASRTRDAISMTRAPSFKSPSRMVLNSAVGSAGDLGMASATVSRSQ